MQVEEDEPAAGATGSDRKRKAEGAGQRGKKRRVWKAESIETRGTKRKKMA